MPGRSGKRSVDVKRPAHRIGDIASGGADEPEREKGPAAVAIGRKGVLKGGKARAEKLRKEERASATKKAVTARWAE